MNKILKKPYKLIELALEPEINNCFVWMVIINNKQHQDMYNYCNLMTVDNFLTKRSVKF